MFIHFKVCIFSIQNASKIKYILSAYFQKSKFVSYSEGHGGKFCETSVENPEVFKVLIKHVSRLFSCLLMQEPKSFSQKSSVCHLTTTKFSYRTARTRPYRSLLLPKKVLHTFCVAFFEIIILESRTSFGFSKFTYAYCQRIIRIYFKFDQTC
jgi:hypothetical protein